jgi:hypothetical protein
LPGAPLRKPRDQGINDKIIDARLRRDASMMVGSIRSVALMSSQQSCPQCGKAQSGGPRKSGNAASKAAVKRAIAAVEDSHHSVAAVDFPPAGGFRILIGNPVELGSATRSDGSDDWDKALGISKTWQ